MKNKTKYHFGAGPSMIPFEVLQDIKRDFMNWNNLGISIIEINHRSKEFMQLKEDIDNTLRTLLNIPECYHILLLSGSSRGQFGMIPINFIGHNECAIYWISGLWSLLAYKEANRLKTVYCISNNTIYYENECKNIIHIRDANIHSIRYLYFTDNETVDGIRFVPNFTLYNDIPIVVDMTSSLLTEPINIRKYSLIFAGTQKNISNSGSVLIIVKEDFLNTIKNKYIPSILDYRIHVKDKSNFSTPPIFNYYVMSKMLKWIMQNGGIKTLYNINYKKSKMLYDFIDTSSLYYCKIPKNIRSLVNICFYLQDKNLEDIFVKESEKYGFLFLKGHRLVGGLRASIYNAMPLIGVEKLINFMIDFSKKHGYE